MKSTARLATAVILASLVFSINCGVAADQPPALPGTHWQLMSLTSKTEKITDAQNPADVEFNKDGTWGVLHYGGRREAGKYEVKGDRLVMKTEDGAVYSDSKMTWKPGTEILELLSKDEYLMRLKLFKPKK